MERNKSTPRNPLEIVDPTAQRGEVTFVDWLPPAVAHQTPVTGAADTALRRLPGHRAVVQLAGSPFRFEVRVVEEPGLPPRVVDLRVYSPPGFGDVAITNADLKSIPLARIAAAAGSGVLTSLRGDMDAIPDRLATPEKHTEAAKAGHKTMRGRGRPRKLTDEFLHQIADFAREGHRLGQPIPQYVAACVEPEPRNQARPDTVRWWLAKAREKKILMRGELAGKWKPRPGRMVGTADG